MPRAAVDANCQTSNLWPFEKCKDTHSPQINLAKNNKRRSLERNRLWDPFVLGSIFTGEYFQLKQPNQNMNAMSMSIVRKQRDISPMVALRFEPECVAANLCREERCTGQLRVIVWQMQTLPGSNAQSFLEVPLHLDFWVTSGLQAEILHALQSLDLLQACRCIPEYVLGSSKSC